MIVPDNPSARTREAQENLLIFIEAGRRSKAFGQIHFDADVWTDVLVKQRPVTAGRPSSPKFYFQTQRGRGRNIVGPSMRSPFAEFVKAALRLQEDSGPKMYSRHIHTISVCRALHDALSEVGFDPCRALPRHFDLALKSLTQRATASSAFQAGAALARVASWIDQHGIGRVRLGWKNPLKMDDSKGSRISVEAAAARAKKLPPQRALDVLPEISQLVSGDADVLRMRVIELLICGGWRINEVLGLPADCEVPEKIVENGKVRERYGIRFFGGKGFGPSIKWIPSPMIDVAKRAIVDVTRLTQAVRDDAIWLRANPGRHPLFATTDPDQLLSMREVAELLGMPVAGSALRWLKMRRAAPLRKGPSGRRRTDNFIRAADLEALLLELVEAYNAPGRVPLEKALFLVRTNAMSGRSAGINGTVEQLRAHSMHAFIVGAPNTRNVFERFGFFQPDGSPVRVRSHQFRHWLNTLAQEGGMSQELIARWSSRKDMHQNAVYDHVSGIQLAEKVRALAEAGELIGPIARVRDSLPPVDRQSFMKTQVATCHVTEIGLCGHDWSLVPCEIHGQCAGCFELLIDKGNTAQKAEVERQMAEVEVMLRVAEREDALGTYGASRWAVSYRRQLASLRRVCAVHEDRAIADGTLVQIGSVAEDAD